MRTEIWTLAAIAAGGALLACSSGSGRSDEELGGLVKRESVSDRPVIAVDATVSAAELQRAVTQPHSRVSEQLGAHTFRGTSTVRVTAGDKVVRELSDETAIDFAATGDFRATLDNSRDYGRHAVFAGGVLYLRPRFGKYHKRAPTSDDEPDGIRNDIYATFGDYLDLLSPATTPIGIAGEATVGGRAGLKAELRLVDPPRERTETAAQKKWREDATVLAVEGYVVLDKTTAAVLEGELRGSVAFTHEGTSYTMTVEATHRIDATAAVEVAAPPDEQTVATRLRPHELEEREQLLEGIAPPLRKTPVPP